MDARTTIVIGLTGASGGLGTSTVAAAVAGLAGHLGRSALLVDLLPNAGGLDHLVGCAHEPGVRWPVREEGMLALSAAHLPSWRSVRVLSQRGAVRPAPPLGPLAVQAVARLAQGQDVAVLDLPPAGHPHAERWSALCDEVVIVAGTTPPQVAAALVTRDLLPAATALVLSRSPRPGLDPADVARAVGLPVRHELREDPTVGRAVLEQEWPGVEPGSLRDCAAAVLAHATGLGSVAA